MEVTNVHPHDKSGTSRPNSSRDMIFFLVRRHSVYSLVNGSRQGFFGCVGRKKNNKKNSDFLFVGEKKVLHIFMSDENKHREGEKRVAFNKDVYLFGNTLFMWLAGCFLAK